MGSEPGNDSARSREAGTLTENDTPSSPSLMKTKVLPPTLNADSPHGNDSSALG